MLGRPRPQIQRHAGGNLHIGHGLRVANLGRNRGTACVDERLLRCAHDISDPPPDSDDYVMAWTFPESGSFVAETSGAAAVLGVAPSDCEAEITSCEDECFGDASGLILKGEAGETVHLIVETFDAGGSFSLSIQPGTTFTCETESEGTTTGGFGGESSSSTG